MDSELSRELVPYYVDEDTFFKLNGLHDWLYLPKNGELRITRMLIHFYDLLIEEGIVDPSEVSIGEACFGLIK